MTKKILIVDDEADVRTTLADIFIENGHKVIEAASGEEVLEKVRREKPDVVLLDTKMPGMDGIEICRQIKKVEKLATKVIVYTGKIDAIDAVKARYAGVDDYCVKGIDPSLLIETVERLFIQGQKDEK